MYSFVFVTHGKLGETLVKTAEFIMNADFSDRIDAFSIDYSMISDMNKIQEAIQKASERSAEKKHKVIIFVDIFGGSPSNVAFTLSKRDNVDIISGVNLPMVIYAFEHMDKDISISDLVEGIVQSGADNIISAKKLIENKEKNCGKGT